MDSPGSQAPALETSGLDDADVDSPGFQAPALETSGLDDADVDSPGSQATARETSGLDDAPALETSGLDDADADSLGSQASVLVTSGLDEDRKYQEVEKPVTIGSGEHCDFRLQAGPGVFAEHARLWWRDSRLMLHNLAPGHATVVSGRDIMWTCLEDGDEAAIGPYLLRIALQREEYQQEDGIGLAENRWQHEYSENPLIRKIKGYALSRSSTAPTSAHSPGRSVWKDLNCTTSGTSMLYVPEVGRTTRQ